MMVCVVLQLFFIEKLLIAGSEYAEYTSAQERIALGKKSRKVEVTKRREMMQELITEAYVGPSSFLARFMTYF